MNPNEDRNHTAYVRGCKAFHAQRYAEAVSWFKEAIAEWAEDYQAHFALGNSYSESGKHRKAELAYREALRLAPKNEQPNIQFNLGNAHFDRGDFCEALAVFEAIPADASIRGKAMINAALARAALGKQPNHLPKPAAEAAPRLKHSPSRGGVLTRR